MTKVNYYEHIVIFIFVSTLKKYRPICIYRSNGLRCVCKIIVSP